MSEKRDFKDPRYKKWRRAVYARDRWRCRMPGCKGGGGQLNAHHIKCWASWPTLRFVVSNGIALCRQCHQGIWGREQEFEALFTGIVSQGRSQAALKILMMRYAQRDQN